MRLLLKLTGWILMFDSFSCAERFTCDQQMQKNKKFNGEVKILEKAAFSLRSETPVRRRSIGCGV